MFFKLSTISSPSLPKKKKVGVLGENVVNGYSISIHYYATEPATKLS
jgi:hypothetical protein